jgi:hypothetical protein
MALPEDLYTVQVTGYFTDPAGTPQRGTVSFTPSVLLADPGDSVVIWPVTRTYNLSAGSFTSDPLVATDSTLFTVSGWTYLLTICLDNQQPYSFQAFIPHTTSPVDISQLAPASPVPAMGSYLPLSGGSMLGPLYASENPTSALEVATMGYVESQFAGLQAKAPCQEATATVLPNGPAIYSGGVLSPVTVGALVVDGVTVALSDRVLVKAETEQASNGIYVCSATGSVSTPWQLTRSADMDTPSQVPGAYAFVENGDDNAGFGFIVAGTGPYVLGTSPIVWEQFTSAGNLAAGTGLTLSGDTISLNTPVSIGDGGTGSQYQNFVTRPGGTTNATAPLPFYNIKDFGAACDGETDDTAAWNAFISYLGSPSDMAAATVDLPGLSVISSTLLFELKSVWIRGSGWGTSGVSAGSGFIWNGEAGVPMLRFEACYSARVSRLRFQATAAAMPSAAISVYDASDDASGSSFHQFEELWTGFWYWGGPGGNQFSSGILWEGSNQNGDRSRISGCVFQNCVTGVSITQTQNVLNQIDQTSFIDCTTGLNTQASCYGRNLTFLTCGTDMVIGQSARVTIDGYASEASGQMASMSAASLLAVKGGYWQLSNTLAGSGSAGNCPVIGGDSTSNSISLDTFQFTTEGYTNPGTPVIATGQAAPAPTLQLLNVGLGSVVPDLQVDAASGRQRIYFGNQNGGPPFANLISSAEVGYAWEPVTDTSRLDLGMAGTVTAMARNGLILGNAALDTVGVNPRTGQPTVWGGTGAPSSGLGNNGDYYFRYDGTPWVYFKSAGAWASIAISSSSLGAQAEYATAAVNNVLTTTLTAGDWVQVSGAPSITLPSSGLFRIALTCPTAELSTASIAYIGVGTSTSAVLSYSTMLFYEASVQGFPVSTEAQHVTGTGQTVSVYAQYPTGDTGTPTLTLFGGSAGVELAAYQIG